MPPPLGLSRIPAATRLICERNLSISSSRRPIVPLFHHRPSFHPPPPVSPTSTAPQTSPFSTTTSHLKKGAPKAKKSLPTPPCDGFNSTLSPSIVSALNRPPPRNFCRLSRSHSTCCWILVSSSEKSHGSVAASRLACALLAGMGWVVVVVVEEDEDGVGRDFFAFGAPFLR